MSSDRSETPSQKPAETPPEGEALPPQPDLEAADRIVIHWTRWAAGLGLVPLPLVDFASTAGFSLKMLSELSAHFGVPFERDVGKSAVAALLGGLAAPVAGMGLISALKGLPIIGLPLAVMTGPVTCGGITYGVGRVFTAHFASGGTLLDFDAEAAKASFKEQVEAGKAFVKRRGKPAPPPPDPPTSA